MILSKRPLVHSSPSFSSPVRSRCLFLFIKRLTLIYSRSSPCWTSSLVPHPRLVHCVCFSPSRCCLTQLTLTIITVTRFHPLNRCKMKSSRTSLRNPCVRPRRRRRLLLLARRRPRRKRVRLLVGKGKMKWVSLQEDQRLFSRSKCEMGVD